MASSDNMASIEPWMIRPSMADSWLAEYIARDAETLTKALQKSISGEDAVSPFYNLVKPDAASPATPTVSSLSGSDQDSAPKRHRTSAAVPPTGKVAKRKSRASKRSQTTFITADPANFRQMVQQVTGVRFGGSHVQMAPVLKPEPQRAAGVGAARFSSAGAGCLPTLDTSAYLLDHHQQQVVVGPNSAAAGAGFSGPGPYPLAQSLVALDAGGSFASAGLDYDTFSSFPTLESWKVM
ncbi:calmodulin-binding protein 25-like [Gastrolobium bilobum]|uniref:calmodulin-binding protein 25-like n=1 Tax=Gastrolobium bilobum TaxID=150636 RepID=UPI002AB1F2E4|nr:calmodulin-binding protein 25-like [Gastrolobium bilobum]